MTRFTAFSVGDFVHCIKRGAFGNEIFRDTSDYWRFVRLLYLCNDEFQDHNFTKLEKTLQIFERPPHWPVRQPLVDIISWCAMPNHFHLLLRQRREGGVSKFMQRLCSSITNGYNLKYENQGSIFQAKYKPVLVLGDAHMYQLVPYINVKNVMELYPDGGLEGAFSNFDTAWEWAKENQFSSIKTFMFGASSPILSMNIINDLGYPKTEQEFKRQSHECISYTLTKLGE